MNPDVELKDITLLKDECTINEKYLIEIKKREGIEEIKGNVSNPKLKDGLHVYFSDEDKEKLLQFNDDFILKQFVSYAVGCMMGRYSLDTKGLAYAGGDFDKSKYSSFIPDDDAILPVLEDAYFQDDIVTRFEEFLTSSFGKDTLQQNLDFVASAIGKKGNEIALDTIRRYMFKDFYKDHVQKYKKKPIYWMFSSGKENAFNALVYLHRYNKNTVARLRTEYLHKLQGKYEGELNTLEQQQSNAKTDKAKKLLIKKLEEFRKYDELLRDIADKEIHLDLDDGVDVNYDKLKSILAKR
ncbi:hypothetical protein H6762_03320 [Candidatus Nomurabacteria bacterium]|nr:hypothetical protein [Candidatus Nomurabacteria bacterium]